MFKQLVDFKAQNGHTNVLRSQKGMDQLNYWVNEQRTQYHLGKIKSDRKKRLEEIGFDWKGEKRRDGTDIDFWKENYNKLVDYYNENGNSDVPARYTKDKSLGTWCVSQRVRYDENKLYEWQTELLEEILFKWDPKNKFNSNFQELLAFKQKHGHLKVPTQGSIEYKFLGRWVNKLRVTYKGGTIDSKGNIVLKGKSTIKSQQINRLNEIGFLWSVGNLDWDVRFNELHDYFKANGHSNISQKDNKSLYQWCYAQSKTDNNLDPEKIEKLNSIDFNFGRKRGKNNIIWVKRIAELKEFFKENGHYDIPKDSVRYKKLVNWLRTQRNYQLNGKLTKEQERNLDQINFSLKDYFLREHRLLSWEEYLLQLKKHYEITGRFHIPSYNDDTRDLLSWIRVQKNLYKQGRLKKEKENKLREIGYSFDVIYRVKLGVLDDFEPDENWYLKLEELKDYVSLNGSFNISSLNKAKRTLRSWILHQQSLNRYKKLGVKKYELLKEINFPFNEYV